MLVLLFVLSRSARLRRETRRTMTEAKDTALGSFRIIIGPNRIYISTVNKIEIRDSLLLLSDL